MGYRRCSDDRGAKGKGLLAYAVLAMVKGDLMRHIYCVCRIDLLSVAYTYQWVHRRCSDERGAS